MKTISFENFLKGYGIDIYEFISYIDTTQSQTRAFINFYDDVVRKRIKNIKIRKAPISFVRDYIGLYKSYYFDAKNPKDWIIDAFSFNRKVFNFNTTKWFKINSKWLEVIDEVKKPDKIIVFNPNDKIKIRKNKKLKI